MSIMINKSKFLQQNVDWEWFTAKTDGSRRCIEYYYVSVLFEYLVQRLHAGRPYWEPDKSIAGEMFR